MTVSENIADLGGVACVTQIAQENGYDLEAVYEAYANIWAFKGREEYLAMQIATDVPFSGKDPRKRRPFRPTGLPRSLWD